MRSMVRVVIIGIVIAVAFTLYALVDAAMTDGSRARGVSKPVWVVLVVVLPVIGGLLWFLIGKGQAASVRQKAPDDDPRFTGTRLSQDDLDDHMKDLEARLRELDEEVFPGEVPDGEAKGTPTSSAKGSSGSGPNAPKPASGAPAGGGSGSGSGSGSGPVPNPVQLPKPSRDPGSGAAADDDSGARPDGDAPRS